MFKQNDQQHPFLIQLGVVILNKGEVGPWFDLSCGIHSIKIMSQLPQYKRFCKTYHLKIPYPQSNYQKRFRLELASMNPQYIKKELDPQTLQYNNLLTDIHQHIDEYRQDRLLITTHPHSLFFKECRMTHIRHYKNKVYDSLVSQIQPNTYTKRDSLNQPPLSIEVFKTTDKEKKDHFLIKDHCLFFKQQMDISNVVNNYNRDALMYRLKQIYAIYNQNNPDTQHTLIREKKEETAVAA